VAGGLRKDQRGVLAPGIKRTSVLRRVPPHDPHEYLPTRGLEGDVCAFKVAAQASAFIVEAPCGRIMTLVPGDVFLASPGDRESTRWVVGSVPDGGLIPGGEYWVLAQSGVVGALIGDSPRAKAHLGRVVYLGTIADRNGKKLRLRQFAIARAPALDRGAALFLVLGTSAEVGKTTAAIAILRALRQRGHKSLIALKATGTSSLTELLTYRDFGATTVFDCVDFGLPTTYPTNRDGIEAVFARAVAACLSLPADAIVIECGGDLFGANVPAFLRCLKGRRPGAKVVLAAPDTSAALGAKRALRTMGYPVDIITGPCTDTPVLQARTQAMCATPAVNMAMNAQVAELV